MKTIINLFHPNFKQSRVNKRLADQVKGEFEVRNLAELYPDFMIDVKKRATGTGKSGSGRFTVSYAMVFVTSVAETVGRSSADLWLGVWKQGNGTAWQRAADRRYGRGRQLWA